MAVKLLKKLPFFEILQYLCLHLILPCFLFNPFPYTYLIYSLVYKSSSPTLVFRVNSPLNHRANWHTVMPLQTGAGLCDFRGEPAMGSVMDFGTRAGDWTLELRSEPQLEFCHFCVP